MNNKEQMTELVSYNLEISENIARLTSEIDNDIMEVWKIDRKDLEEALNIRNNLIKYLEKESKEVYRDGGVRQNIFRGILERVRSGNYE